MDTPQEQQAPIEIIEPAGLSLKVDVDSRDPMSFQLLDNMDHYINGSIRKVLPPTVYGGPYGNPATTILNFIEYRVNDSAPLRIIGVGADANLYDVTTGALVGSLTKFVGLGPLTVPPFLAVLPGTFIPYNFRAWAKNTVYAIGDAIIKYSPTDGNLYIFSVTAITTGITGATEQQYPATGVVVDGGVTWTNQGLQVANTFQCNYLTITVPGFSPMKWDANSGMVTQVGVSAPEVPANVVAVEITPNLDGYAPTVGAFYAYTFFNPQTLHESSPSPIAIQTQFFAIDQGETVSTPGSFLPTLPVVAGSKSDQQRSYQIVGVEVPAGALVPAIGQNYTHLRFYRTKDGGATFFLLIALFDASGNQISNSDGSVPIAMMPSGTTDYVPLPTPQSVQPVLTVYEGYGNPNLVAAPTTLDPNFWNDKSGGKIFVVEGDGNDGANAFEYVGTGAASGELDQGAGPIAGTQVVNYTIQAFIDATQQASGKISVRVVHWDQTVVLEAAQVNGTAGTVSATGMLGGVRNVYFQVHENGIVNTGLSVLWSNFFLQKGNSITPVGYPTLDASLVTPSPAVESSGPPPVAQWAAVYQGSFYVLDDTDRTKVWFSDSIDFESFGTTSYLRFPTDTADPVTCLSSTFNALIIGKKRSTQQILGNNFSNFQPTPIDPQHGILGKRALVAVGSSLVALLNEGLAILGLALNISSGAQVETSFRPEGLLGDPVQPITDRILPSALDSTICFTYHTKLGILLFAIQTVAGVGNNELLMLTLSNKPKFSRYPTPPANILTIRECELPTGQIVVLMSCTDGNVYTLFGGFQDVNPLIAFATTQELPMPSQMPRQLWGERKVFKELWVDGQDIVTRPGGNAIGNWMVAYQTDNGLWSIPIPLKNRTQIGQEGIRLTMAFMHNGPTCNVPLLTYWNVDWDVAGKTR
jgi:hypothetical protein